MSDDLISRQMAIDEIKEIYEWHDNVTEARIIEHFKRMPSAQPEPQWIPCRERLPEDGIYVLGYMAYGQCSVLKCEGDRLYTAGCWVPLPKNAVTHWQYLPDAPKGEEE